MRLCDIKNKPVRLLAFVLTIPISLFVFLVVLVVYSTCHSLKCALHGFVDYYNDKNVLITYKSLRAMGLNAWYGNRK